MFRIVEVERRSNEVVLDSSSPEVRFGRDPSQCRFVLPTNAPGVSRVHARVVCSRNGILMVHDQSAYGTEVNGTKIVKDKREVLSGQTIKIGEHEFLVEAVSVFNKMPSSQRSTRGADLDAEVTPVLAPSKKSDVISKPTTSVVLLDEDDDVELMPQPSAHQMTVRRVPMKPASRSEVTPKPSVAIGKVSENIQSQRKRVSSTEGNAPKQSKISSFFGSSQRKIVPVDEDDEDVEVLCDDTPNNAMGISASQRSNTTVVPESVQMPSGSRSTTVTTRMTKKSLLGAGGAGQQKEKEDKLSFLAEDTPVYEQMGKSAPPNSRLSIGSIVGDTLDADRASPKPATPNIRSCYPKIGSGSSTSMSQRSTYKPPSSNLTLLDVDDDVPVTTSRSTTDKITPAPRIAPTIGRSTRGRNGVQVKKTLIISDDDDAPRTASASGSTDEIQMPPDDEPTRGRAFSFGNSPPVSGSQAPTIACGNLEEGLAAISPKKSGAGNSTQTTTRSGRTTRQTSSPEFVTPLPPPSLPNRGRRALSTTIMSENTSEPAAKRGRAASTASTLRRGKTPRGAPIQEVEEEFKVLYSQLCSGKKIKDEDMEEDDEEDKTTTQRYLERQQMQVEEVRKNMAKLICYSDLGRPATQSVDVSVTVAGTPSGRPNFKKFKKAAQGRFNLSVSSSSNNTLSTSVRLAGDDLVDYRKMR